MSIFIIIVVVFGIYELLSLSPFSLSHEQVTCRRHKNTDFLWLWLALLDKSRVCPPFNVILPTTWEGVGLGYSLLPSLTIYTFSGIKCKMWQIMKLFFMIIFVLVQVSASKVLQETCNYIKTLHREVDDLSDRLSQLLATTDSNSAQAAIIRSLLM